MSSGRGFSTVDHTNCVISATTKGTTLTGVTTSNTITYSAYANSKTGSTTFYVTQAANEVVDWVDYQTPSGATFTAENVPAAGGEAVILPNLSNVTTKAKAVYTSTATASSYTTRTVTSGITTGATSSLTVPSKGLVYGSAVTTVGTIACWYA
jgi:hypothetical protein